MDPIDWQAVDRERQSRYRPARTRSRWAMLMVGLATLDIAYQILTVARGFELVDRAGRVTQVEVSLWQRDLANASTGWIAFVALAAIAVFAWQSRVVDNIPALTGDEPWVTPRWSIALWFVPLASFVAPYRIIADAWRRLAIRPDQRRTAIVVAWWLLFLGGGLANRIIQFATPTPGTPAALRSLLQLVTAAGIAQIVGGILFIWIVREIERRSEARAELNAIQTATVASGEALTAVPAAVAIPE